MAATQCACVFVVQFGQASPHLYTQASASVLDNIQTVFGRTVARELLPISCGSPQWKAAAAAKAGAGAGTGAGGSSGETAAVTAAVTAAAASDAPGDPVPFVASGYVSNANFSLKKSVVIVFINHRLVDCPSLKKVRASASL